MKRRIGEMSTPIKILVVAVASVVVLLVYLSVSENLITGIEDPIKQFVFGALGDY